MRPIYASTSPALAWSRLFALVFKVLRLRVLTRCASGLRKKLLFAKLLMRTAKAPPSIPMTELPQKNSRPRVLSGMRPTGKLHLGNYVGALQNWVKLQKTHDCFFFVADWHALTTDYDDTSRLADNSLEVVLDFLAAGLDPEQCAIFVQSHVREHAELHLLFSMITPLGWLERVPIF